MFKTAFNALPDVHKAFESANEVVSLIQQHVPDHFGTVLVSGVITGDMIFNIIIIIQLCLGKC